MCELSETILMMEKNTWEMEYCRRDRRISKYGKKEKQRLQ
ncbi:hypothetical protein OK016_13640 [Vibrio chagasii]|nr:hypothetical protein [Vibrio chagasii]